MKPYQIRTADDLLSAWPFIHSCCVAVSDSSQEQVDPDVIFKVVSAILAHPDRGWVATIGDGFGRSIGFGVVEDATPAYSPDRIFNVRFLHHVPGRHDASTALQRGFESWAKRNKVRFYTVTTRRTSGAAIRCIRSRQYGFRRAHLVFEKEIK